MGKNIFEFIYEADKDELVKQFADKYQGESVAGMGVNSHGDLVNMNINYTTVTGQ